MSDIELFMRNWQPFDDPRDRAAYNKELQALIAREVAKGKREELEAQALVTMGVQDAHECMVRLAKRHARRVRELTHEAGA